MKQSVLTLLVFAASLLLGTAKAQLPIFQSKNAEAAILKYNQGGPNQAIVTSFIRPFRQMPFQAGRSGAN